MGGDEIEIPIYLITGFLESGKTTFINFTVAQDYFQIDEPTLLITTEEGEVEYDEKELLKYNTVLEVVESQEQFTPEYLKKLKRRYNPERVILEYNPLWSVKKLEEMEMPRGWGIVQEIVTVDASCFQIYMQNMKSIFMEMSLHADMVMFNRCTSDLPLANFRRSIKVVNPRSARSAISLRIPCLTIWMRTSLTSKTRITVFSMWIWKTIRSGTVEKRYGLKEEF